MNRCIILPVAAALAACATPAMAGSPGQHGGWHGGGHHGGGHQGGGVIVMPPYHSWRGNWGGWMGTWQPPITIDIPNAAPPMAEAAPADRTEWLRECRRRLGDSGVGGAVIGGVVGGVAGNVLAGPGDKVLGTVAGAAIGAVAGAAIDKAEDAPRARDHCQATLDAWGTHGYAAGYAGAAPYGYMLVPVMMVPVPGQAARGPCKETVVTEDYEPDGGRMRQIPPRAPRRQRAPDKRVPAS